MDVAESVGVPSVSLVYIVLGSSSSSNCSVQNGYYSMPGAFTLIVVVILSHAHYTKSNKTCNNRGRIT